MWDPQFVADYDMLMVVSWIVMMCVLGGIYQCFGGTYFLHLQG
jgi:hypothetical protein